MRSVWTLGLVVGLSALGATACSIETSDAEKYREPLPAEGSVALRVPGGSGASATSTRDLNGGGGPSATVSDAKFYSFTRELTSAMDQNTGAILAIIWAVAQTTPTSVYPNRAVWGPYQGTALEPVTWRLVVSEGGSGEYDYALEGRARNSTNDADFRAVLKGRGYGKSHALHQTGWLEADNEAFRSLDPAKAKDFGKTKVTYDVRQFPKTIAVDFVPDDGVGKATAKVSHHAQGAGVLDVTANADIEKDADKDGKLETVVLKSQWNASGAGRADVSVSGGSFNGTPVDIVECWSSSFSLAYYKDSVSSQPKTGAESACASF